MVKVKTAMQQAWKKSWPGCRIGTGAFVANAPIENSVKAAKIVFLIRAYFLSRLAIVTCCVSFTLSAPSGLRFLIS